MAAPSTNEEFLELVRKSGVVEEKRLDAYLKELRAAANVPAEPGKLAGILVRDGILTHFQAEQFLLGKWRRFTIGKYKVLERLGSGGMGSVYLCEHKFMRRRVAVKVLPAAKAEDPSSLERFYREARAAAALDHPNIVRAYDIDQDENLHFLVMEYVDGASLQEIVKKHGPMNVLRAAHYILQAAVGLHHAHEAGLVHRDIKPGNLLVDRNGTVKVLDMGLARFFRDEDDILTKKYDENVLGTADYLAPEQALDSHGVDIRADVYSLGATFYYLLTGHPPFSEGTVAQKLIWHQTRQPKAIRTLRPDVPEGLVAVVEKMMAKDAAQRYQTPLAVVDALMPWTETPIEPPPETEMPRLSLAAGGAASGEVSQAITPKAAPAGSTAPPRKPGAALTPSSTPVPRTSASTLPRPGTEPGRASNVTPAPGIQSNSVATDNGLATMAPPGQSSSIEDPNSPWESLATDTDDHSARADTAEQSSAITTSIRRLASQTWMSAFQDRRRFWIVVASVAAAVLVILAVVIWLVVRGQGSGPPSIAPVLKTETVLVVGPESGDCRTLAEAIEKAKSEDTTIKVRLAEIAEQLDLRDSRLPKGLTIVGDLPNRVRWQPPPNPRDRTPLLHVFSQREIDGLCLKNFVMNGQDKVDDLVVLFGRCPGLRLENLQLEGFNHSGIKLMNCAGTEERPVKLVQVRLLGKKDKDVDAALVFSVSRNMAGSPPENQFIRVHDCRFEGRFKTAVQLIGSAVDLEFARNRFFQLGDGFFYRTHRGPEERIIPQPRIQLTLESNTFSDLQGAALHLEALPQRTDKSQIVLKNNLIAKTAVLGQVDNYADVPPKQPATPAKWIWFSEEKGDPLKDAPAESRYFRKSFTPPSVPITKALLEIAADGEFTVSLNGAALAKGQFNQHVAMIDVTAQLRSGPNVLAVQATNKKVGPAGLLAQLTITPGSGTPIVTDKAWKASKTAPVGWEKPDFKDDAWPAAKELAGYGGQEVATWQNLIWDSLVPEQITAAAKPIFATVAGNVCDPATRQGNLLLTITPMPFVLPADPKNEAAFLRYSKSDPLSKAGVDSGPVGAPPPE